MDVSYQDKYIKYKIKLLNLQHNTNQIGRGKYNPHKPRRSDKQTAHKAPPKKTMQTVNQTHKHIEHVSEPWFSLISLGLKTVEGRKNKGRFKEMKVNDLIEWRNNDFNPRTVITRIVKKVEYQTFEEYLTKEGLKNCLPGITDMEDGLSVYFKYFTKQQERDFGVMAIHLELVKQ